MEAWSQRQPHGQHSIWMGSIAGTEAPETLPPGVLSASEALSKMQRKRPLRRRRPRPSRMRAQASHSKSQKSGEDDPNVVFFPTSQSDSAEAQCQDFDAQGNGFNAFAFLSFLLTVFNAVR